VSLTTTTLDEQLDDDAPITVAVETGAFRRSTNPRRSKTRGEQIIAIVGAIGLIGVVFTVWLGLWITPPDEFMGNLVRLLYVHPAIAWVMYLAYGGAFLSSLAYLWRRTRSPKWDRLAGSFAEVGVVFTGLTLVTGSIWGRPTWGAWWTWDPLLTTTALLFVLYLGYLAVRRIPGDPEVCARRSAIAALVAFVDVPICYFSVLWWRSLHQAPTGDDPINGKTYIHGSMAWTLLLSFVALTLVFSWLVAQRYRLYNLAALEEEQGLSYALDERRSEGAESTVGGNVMSGTSS